MAIDNNATAKHYYLLILLCAHRRIKDEDNFLIVEDDYLIEA